MKKSMFLKLFASKEACCSLCQDVLGDETIQEDDLLDVWSRAEEGISHLNVLLKDGRLLVVMQARHEAKDLRERMAFEVAELAVKIRDLYGPMDVRACCCFVGRR